MIKSILIINNHGVPRLSKFYQNVGDEDVQQLLIKQIFQLVAQRPDTFCNYIELDPSANESSTSNSVQNNIYNILSSDSSSSSFSSSLKSNSSIKIIYRHYATLYFIFIVDSTESYLGILDLIQVLVEGLDKSFENVCELDLIFHTDKVHFIIDEIVIGGLVMETNINNIMFAVNEQFKLHSNSLNTPSSQIS